MARRQIFRSRRGVITTTVAVIAVGAAITGGVVGPSFDNADVTPPAAFLTSPADGATVSGTATVSATCGDNVGCAGVQFKLNGANLGAEDTSAPFSTSWDTTQNGAGTYTLSALARDAAGNTVTARSVSAIIASPGGAPLVANVFAVADGSGSSGCTRVGSPVSFASATGHICNTWQQACDAATAGDTVGIEPGAYANPNGTARYIATDCSDGLGVDVNPNATEQGVSTGTTANWVTFKCDSSTPRAVSLYLGGAHFGGNEHTIFDGTSNQCFYFPDLGVGDSSLAAKNEQFKNMWLGGFDLPAGTDILLQDSQIGPSVKCAADTMNDPGTNPIGAQNICNPAGPWYESQYATFNPSSNTEAQCASLKVNCGGDSARQNEPFIHNAFAVQPTNIRWQNVWVHDQQSYNAGFWHPGCLITNSTGVASDSNIVIDRLKCERVAVQGIQNEQSGTTIENSVFACSTYPIFDGNNPSNLWALCGNNPNVAIGFSAGLSFSHFIVRYNTFAPVSTAFIWRCGTNTYTTTRMIGNVGADGMAAVCSGTGNVTDRNTSYNSIAGVGTNSESLTGSPLTNYDAGTAYADTTQIDMSLSGSPAVQTIPNSAGADYVVSDDYPGTSRVDPTHAGAYK